MGGRIDLGARGDPSSSGRHRMSIVSSRLAIGTATILGDAGERTMPRASRPG
jgi:hypothetical protein